MEKTLESFMQEKLNWQCSDYDQAIFYKSWNDGTWVIVGFWVDDATSIGHQQRLLELEDAFKEHFGLSDECDVHWILGTAITRNMDQNSVSISQRNYIEDIVAKFHIGTSMRYKTPIPLSIDFTALMDMDEEKEESKNFPYHELIGSLMYAATVSRPDIAYSVNKLARYSSKPNRVHWNLAK